MASAARGAMAREEIIVATMLLESFMPFINAYTTARAMIAISTGLTNPDRTWHLSEYSEEVRIFGWAL